MPNYVPKLCSQTMIQTLLPNYVPNSYSQNYVPKHCSKLCCPTIFQNSVPKLCSQTMSQTMLPNYVKDRSNLYRMAPPELLQHFFDSASCVEHHHRDTCHLDEAREPPCFSPGFGSQKATPTQSESGLRSFSEKGLVGSAPIKTWAFFLEKWVPICTGTKRTGHNSKRHLRFSVTWHKSIPYPSSSIAGNQ